MAEVDFGSAFALLRWTNRKIREFQDMERAFVDRQPYKILFYDSVVENKLISRSYKAVAIQQPPDEMAEASYRIIGDLRNALDHATSAASKAIMNEEGLTKTDFPFGDAERYVESQLASKKGPWSEIPVELHSKLTSFEPFLSKTDGSEGNVMLWALNKAANSNKHQTALVTEFREFGFDVYTVVGGAFFLKIKRTSDTEVELYHFILDGAPHAECAVGIRPVVSLAGGRPFGKEPAVMLFDRLYKLVEAIVLELKEETINIVGR